MAVRACARRLRRAARRSAARALALAILTLLLGGGAVHSTVVTEPPAPAQIAQVDHHAPSTGRSSEIIAAPLVEFPGEAARTAAHTRAPPVA